MVIVSSIVMLYYNMIIAWTLFYMFASWSSTVPWENCDPEWSTSNCYSYVDADKCSNENGTYFNQTCFDANTSASLNLSALLVNQIKKTPAEEYFM